MEKRDYKKLAKAAAKDLGANEMVIYAGEHEADGCPKFKVVFIDEPVRVQKNGRWYWGLTVFDFESEDFYWVEYNHCVSLEGFAVLERLLDMQFPWMGQVGGLRQQTIEQAKALLAAAEDEPYYVEHFDNE